jgi:predicted RNA-binding Zn-ribbon protein involved in translation (DUF1610 family)
MSYSSQLKAMLKVGCRTDIGSRRHYATWTCPRCGRVVEGKKNTIHLGVRSHARSCVSNSVICLKKENP